MKYSELLRTGEERLKKAGIADWKNDARLLLEFRTGITRASYLADRDSEASPDAAEKYLGDLEIRASHVPLQHITGEQEFMGLLFSVTEDVLIPRQDTETLVLRALEMLRPDADILDIGTGSGCILISVLYYAKQRGITGVNGTGCDISGAALAVAERNASRLGVRAELVQSDLFTGLSGKYDMILSNPPYIPTAVIETLEEEVKDHDPYNALDGKEDGLFFYRRIVEQSRDFLKTGGALIFEIGYDQGEDVSRMMREAHFGGVTVEKDLAGMDRVVYGVLEDKDV